jgi:hypothetical protein
LAFERTETPQRDWPPKRKPEEIITLALIAWRYAAQFPAAA